MRKSLSGTTEDFCEPPNSFLMRYVRQVVLAEDIRQAVWRFISLRERILLRRPKVTPPGHKGQCNESRDGRYDNDCCQKLSSTRCRNANLVCELRLLFERTQT